MEPALDTALSWRKLPSHMPARVCLAFSIWAWVSELQGCIHTCPLCCVGTAVCRGRLLLPMVILCTCDITPSACFTSHALPIIMSSALQGCLIGCIQRCTHILIVYCTGDALKMLQRCIEQSPELLELYTLQCKILAHAGDLAGAAAAADKARSMDLADRYIFSRRLLPWLYTCCHASGLSGTPDFHIPPLILLLVVWCYTNSLQLHEPCLVLHCCLVPRLHLLNQTGCLLFSSCHFPR